MMCLFLFFFKQKTAYEMRISDWSSDVCSSDLALRTRKIDVLILPSELALDRLHIVSHALGLLDQLLRLADLRLQRLQHSQRQALEVARLIDQRSCLVLEQIGRASCRDRVCKYVSISVVAVSFKKQKQRQR